MPLPVKPFATLLACWLLVLSAASRSADQPAGAGTALAPAEEDAVLVPPRDYSNWYQVEIILFANRNPLESSESTPFKQRYYPANMVAISPNDEDRVAETDAQMAELQAYLDLFDPELQARLAAARLAEAQFDEAGNVLVGDAHDGSNYPENEFQGTSAGWPAIDRSALDASTAVTIDAGADNALDGLDGLDASAEGTLEGTLEGTMEGISDTPPLDPAMLAAILANGADEAYGALPEQDFVLDKIARSLGRSSRYRVLLHQAWRQPMDDESNARPILIQAGDRVGDIYEIDGTLRFHLSRFLHTRADLWFTDFASPAFAAFKTTATTPTAPANTADGLNPLFASDLNNSPNDQFEAINTAIPLAVTGPEAGIEAELAAAVDDDQMAQEIMSAFSYQLQHSRRMRSATLHYIDHPRFGMLVRIDDYKGPVSAAPLP
jgi:hypothetical protein